MIPDGILPCKGQTVSVASTTFSNGPFQPNEEFFATPTRYFTNSSQHYSTSVRLIRIVVRSCFIRSEFDDHLTSQHQTISARIGT